MGRPPPSFRRPILVVSRPVIADLLLNVAAVMWLIGTYNSILRIRHRTGAEISIYDAKMMLKLEDRQGRIWVRNMKPRFLGFQVRF